MFEGNFLDVEVLSKIYKYISSRLYFRLQYIHGIFSLDIFTFQWWQFILQYTAAYSQTIFLLDRHKQHVY